MITSNAKQARATSPDQLGKASGKAAVELTEAALAQASGGAVFPSAPAVGSLKLDSSLKIEGSSVNPGWLLPAVQPKG